MNAEELRAKFESDLKELQGNCKHKESEWMASEFGVGHLSGSVKVCKFCEKVLERKS